FAIIPLVSRSVRSLLFSFSHTGHHLPLHSFPTRRSSDLSAPGFAGTTSALLLAVLNFFWHQHKQFSVPSSPFPENPIFKTPTSRDRKSTRLNSSHLGISYAVFCLKTKMLTAPPPTTPLND